MDTRQVSILPALLLWMNQNEIQSLISIGLGYLHSIQVEDNSQYATALKVCIWGQNPIENRRA